MTNSVFLMRQPHTLVYSFSAGDLNQLVNAMCEMPDAEYRYDSCLNIRNPAELKRAIFESGTVCESAAPVKEVFRTIELGRVSYVPKRLSVRDQKVPPSGPFLKPPVYRKQSECRFALYPNDETHLQKRTYVSDQSRRRL